MCIRDRRFRPSKTFPRFACNGASWLCNASHTVHHNRQTDTEIPQVNTTGEYYRCLRSCCDSNALSFSSPSNLARSESKRRICLSTWHNHYKCQHYYLYCPVVHSRNQFSTYEQHSSNNIAADNESTTKNLFSKVSVYRSTFIRMCLECNACHWALR